jgi:hypothetical protein
MKTNKHEDKKQKKINDENSLSKKKSTAVAKKSGTFI